jgi:hypothetical protein
VTRLIQRLGVNYLWGLANFTLGVTLGGIYVGAALVIQGLVR